jgi:hypothetical protein
MKEKHMIKVGEIDQRVIELLNLSVEEKTSVYIGETNIKHMKESHPEDYEEYKDKINEIIKKPDYVHLHETNGSIGYVKIFKIDDEYVKVAVRVSAKNKLFVRSVYRIDTRRAKKFIEKGTLKKY